MVRVAKIGRQIPGEPALIAPPPRRPPNRLVTDYNPDMARRVDEMAKRRAESRDPELISLARDVIDPPPTNDAGYKMFQVLKTPQAAEVDKLLEQMVSAECDRPY